jgi:predicted RNase H-like nuclease
VSTEHKRVHAVGIDLAWGERPSGLAHLTGPVPQAGESQAAWELRETARIGSLDGIATWLASRVPREAPAWIAVDAPLLATNASGTTRDAELAFARAFAPYRVAAYPTSRETAKRGMALVALLAAQGYSLAIPDTAHAPRRGIFETFPTAAQLHILQLKRPIPYKRGTTAQRQEGLARLALHIAQIDDPATTLGATSALRELLGASPHALTGDRLKAHEDRIDALLASLVAAIAWRYPQRLITYGTLAEGFITVPAPPGI